MNIKKRVPHTPKKTHYTHRVRIQSKKSARKKQRKNDKKVQNIV